MEDSANVDGGNGDFVDIGVFMVHVNYIKDKLWPLASLSKELTKIRRWENYPISLAVVTLICLSVSAPQVLLAFICATLLLIILAGNRHIPKSKHRQHQIQPDVIPRLINEDNESLKAVASSQKSRKRALNDFRQLLKFTDNILMSIGVILDQIKSIFTWDNDRLTIWVLVILVLTVISLLWVPVSVFVSLAIAIFFCWNNNFILETKRVLRVTKLASSTEHVLTQRIHCSSQRDERHTSPLALLTDETIQAKMEELSNSADNVTGGGITQVNGSPTKRDKEMCHKCHKCGSAFNIIKRKYSCSNCGYSYCSSCTVKVPRTVLGATSPAAFQETVRVCLECKSELTNSLTASTSLSSSNLLQVSLAT